MKEDKHTALVVLGVIVILAIIGLLLMVKTVKTGATVAAANRNSMIPYPGGVVHPTAVTYANPMGKVMPYAREARPYIEEPSYVTSKRDPTRTPMYVKGKCLTMAQYGEIESKYTWDATYNQARARSPQDCIQVEGSLKGMCCVPPSSP